MPATAEFEITAMAMAPSVSLNAHYVPSTITVNGLSSSLTFNAMLQITGATGPNGDLQSIAYDTFGRPTMTQSPYGAVQDTTYNIPARTQTVRVRDSSMPQGYGTRFSRTTVDGLGRPVMVESGPMSGMVETVQSVVRTEYEPCACSPLGKVKRQSMPHAPNAMPVWTEYDWDPVLGRAAAVRHAGNTGTTSYTYGRDAATGFEYVKTTTPKGRWKTHIFDAAGNLVKVREPRPGGGEF